jgi:hypothetical protein
MSLEFSLVLHIHAPGTDVITERVFQLPVADLAPETIKQGVTQFEHSYFLTQGVLPCMGCGRRSFLNPLRTDMMCNGPLQMERVSDPGEPLVIVALHTVFGLCERSACQPTVMRLVATADLAMKETFKASGMAWARQTQCASCYSVSPLQGPVYKQCSACRSLRYCSPECQTKDWKAHKALCRTLTKGGH